MGHLVQNTPKNKDQKLKSNQFRALNSPNWLPCPKSVAFCPKLVALNHVLPQIGCLLP